MCVVETTRAEEFSSTSGAIRLSLLCGINITCHCIRLYYPSVSDMAILYSGRGWGIFCLLSCKLRCKEVCGGIAAPPGECFHVIADCIPANVIKHVAGESLRESSELRVQGTRHAA